jgi:undecaprenyl-diphosphatase
VGLLLGGLLTYVLAKVVKRMVVRGRPSTLIDDVHIHGAPSYGLGFVSGHAAVVATLVTIAWPWLNRPARIIVVALTALVCLGRVYVGAHLPLDVVGGVGLGVAVGGLVRLVMGGVGRAARGDRTG